MRHRVVQFARDVQAFLGDQSARLGGALLLELGGEQAELLGPQLEDSGFSAIEVWADEDDDVRGIEATWLTTP